MNRPVNRREQLEANLTAVRGRIDAACTAAGRPPADVGLVVVTKYFPATDVRLLAELGVSDLGENKHQEASAKASETADLGVRWHFIGSIQSNKAAAIAAYADMVESVDRLKLVSGLNRGAHETDRVVDCLIQIGLDPEGLKGGPGGRGGAAPVDVPALAAAIEDAGALRLRGVMAVAPLGGSAEAAFERLAEVAAELRVGHPDASVVSAGMSGDLEEAVKYGATHVRIGSAVLGPRPLIQ